MSENIYQVNFYASVYYDIWAEVKSMYDNGKFSWYRFRWIMESLVSSESEISKNLRCQDWLIWYWV